MAKTIDEEVQERINRVFGELEKAVKAGELQSVAIAAISKDGQIMTMDVSIKGPITLVGLVRLLQKQIEDRYTTAMEEVRSSQNEESEDLN